MLPGGTRVTHLSEPETLTRTGTATVQLGKRPAGATGVQMLFDCLSAGEFTFPDGGSMICDAGDAIASHPLSDKDHPPKTKGVFDLPSPQDDITIKATAGASWRITTTYVSTEVTPWGINDNGDTFGVENDNGTPDLIAVVATNGRTGYAYQDLGVPEPTSPQDAVAQQQERLGKTFSVPVYESDGETVIGDFVVGGDTATQNEDASTTGP